MLIKVARSRDVKMPERGHAHDAGMDFYVPTMDADFTRDFMSKSQNAGISIMTEMGNDECKEECECKTNKGKKYMLIEPGYGAMIPAGVHTEIPIGFMGQFVNKSGVATKKRLLIGAQIIDTFYDGEVHINVHNVSDRDVKVYEGDKLTQMILIPVVHAQALEVELDTLYEGMHEETLRGSDGFGSTDKPKGL